MVTIIKGIEGQSAGKTCIARSLASSFNRGHLIDASAIAIEEGEFVLTCRELRKIIKAHTYTFIVITSDDFYKKLVRANIKWDTEITVERV